MPAVAAIVGILSAITQAMEVSSTLAPSVANDVSIWRQAFSTGNNKKQLIALKASNMNAAAQLAAYIAQARASLDESKVSVTAQLQAYNEKFSADGVISAEEFTSLMALQGLANSISGGYQRLQILDGVLQQLQAAEAVEAK